MAETDSAAETQVEKGKTALAEGRDQDAEAAFRAALDISPNFIPANYHMGLLKLGCGQAADGLPFLQKAAKAQPSTTTLTALGNCFETLGAYDQAIRCYRPVLDKTPGDSNLWARYANLLQSLGQESDAIEAYNSALTHNPRHARAAIKLGWILWKEIPQEAIRVLKIALDETDNLTDRVTLLSALVLFEEWSARLSMKLMPYHATSLDDLFFHSANDTLKEFKSTAARLAESNPENSWALMTNGLATFASGDPDAAQKLFTRVTDHPLKEMAQAIRFDPPFFDELEKTTNSKLMAELPNVETLKEASLSKADVLYMSCNDTYFDMFAKPLLRSLAQNGPENEVHIHLMDSTQEHSDTAIKFCTDLPNVRTALSVERPDFSGANLAVKRAYFHAIRFIRYYHHFLEYQRSLWLMDVDGLFNTSPRDLFLGCGDTDISLRARPGRLEPWNQFNACLIGAHPTSVATKYLHLVAAYIAHFYRQQNLPWGIDQLAMYASFLHLQKHGAAPRLNFLGDKVLDYEYLEDSILWCSSGIGKLSASGKKNIENDPKAKAYDRAFSRHQS